MRLVVFWNKSIKITEVIVTLYSNNKIIKFQKDISALFLERNCSDEKHVHPTFYIGVYIQFGRRVLQ